MIEESKKRPNYHDGKPRKPWEQLGEAEQGSWNRPVWNTLDDEFEEILDGSWAVIRTADGWEIEDQHSMSTFPLTSTDMDSAKIEGEKLAREIETRFLPNASLSHGDESER